MFSCVFKSLIKKLSSPTCSCCVCSLVVWCFAFIHSPIYCLLNCFDYICTLRLNTSHWKCLFCTEHMFQETLYIHNACRDLFTLVLEHLNYTISFYFICCIRIYMDRIEYFVLFYEPLCAERLQWTISDGVFLLGLSYLILLNHVTWMLYVLY